MEKLLIRPYPIDDESLEGYISRLAIRNYLNEIDLFNYLDERFWQKRKSFNLTDRRELVKALIQKTGYEKVSELLDPRAWADYKHLFSFQSLKYRRFSRQLSPLT